MTETAQDNTTGAAASIPIPFRTAGTAGQGARP